MKHGVLQGSFLGLVLFFICVNDLTLNMQETKVVLFADDTNMLVTEKSVCLRHKSSGYGDSAIMVSSKQWQ
jgi:hypothetical protein